MQPCLIGIKRNKHECYRFCNRCCSISRRSTRYSTRVRTCQRATVLGHDRTEHSDWDYGCTLRGGFSNLPSTCAMSRSLGLLPLHASMVGKLVLILLLVLARARENYTAAGSELDECGSCNLTATSHLRNRLPVLAAPGASPAAKGWGSVVVTDAPTPMMWTWPIEATLRSLLVYAPAFLVNSLIIAFDGRRRDLISAWGGAARPLR